MPSSTMQTDTDQGAAELENYFNVFELSADATLDDVDENYHHQSLELHKQKTSNPSYVQQKQQEYDNTYYVLLQHFIREDCKNGQDARPHNFAFNNIGTRAYEPGVKRRLFVADESDTMRVRRAKEQFDMDREDDEEDPDAMRHQSTKDLFRMVNEDLDEDNTSDSEEDEDNDKDKKKNRQLNDDDDEMEEDDEDVVVSKRISKRRTPIPIQPFIWRPNRIFEIEEITGDIFDAPDNAVIVHAVNCQGVWGSGFAAELKRRYPAAFRDYAHWCRTIEPPKSLVGNCVLLRPQPAQHGSKDASQPRHWIACLFTSIGYGRPDASRLNPGKDDVETIAMHTDSALVDLRNDLEKELALGLMSVPRDIYSPRFNAGSFGVPWDKTKDLIAMCFAGYPGRWIVVSEPNTTA